MCLFADEGTGTSDKDLVATCRFTKGRVQDSILKNASPYMQIELLGCFNYHIHYVCTLVVGPVVSASAMVISNPAYHHAAASHGQGI